MRYALIALAFMLPATGIAAAACAAAWRGDSWTAIGLAIISALLGGSIKFTVE